MTLVTVASLQREFGMPLREASVLVNRYRGLASRRHRALYLAASASLLASLACSVAQPRWPAALPDTLWLSALALAGLALYRIHRDSRAPILAAARAWRAAASTHDFG
jgi:hypothetical protein